MEEIIFRAWDNNKKKLCYDVDVYSEKKHNKYWWSGQWYFNNGDRSDFFDSRGKGNVLMRYTGVSDKNNVKVFEGDIIQVDDTDEINHWMRGDICIVKCLPGRFKLENIAGDGNMMQEDMQDVIKVIGNKFDNPMLFKNNE